MSEGNRRYKEAANLHSTKSLTKLLRIYNRERMVSKVNDIGKTRDPQVK
jgi:hypothetical protein